LLFGALLHDLDEFEKPLIVERVQAAFPDCIVKAGGKLVRIEFELYGSNFDHDCKGCDMLVCWRDDCNDWPPGFRVLQLADIVVAKNDRVSLSRSKRITQLRGTNRHFLLWPSVTAQTLVTWPLQERSLNWLRNETGGPIGLVNPKPVFADGTPQFFKVDSRGHIGFPFSRLRAGDAFGELADRLNEVAPTLEIQASDVGTKSKGGQFSQLLKSEEQIRKFFAVWSWFITRA
jgi:hypothetical protein